MEGATSDGDDSTGMPEDRKACGCCHRRTNDSFYGKDDSKAIRARKTKSGRLEKLRLGFPGWHGSRFRSLPGEEA